MMDTPPTPVADTPADTPPSGAERIGLYVKDLPDLPGVYRMVGAQGRVLYVGKAKNLKRRVANYAKPGGHNERISRMIAETAEMVFVTTHSEIEALLLESNLIKRLKPHYNILLRDDKSFPEILVRKDHDFPPVLKHRGARTAKGTYFGPFASASSVNATLDTLQRAFLLRTCTDAVFAARTRPCLLYQIKRCCAPCAGRIDKAGYGELVGEAVRFLRGKSRDLQETFLKEMEAAAEALDFERAAQMRDRVRALAHVQMSQGINPSTFAEADLFAVFGEGGRSCVQVFFFCAGQNWGNQPFFPRHGADAEAAEILEAFIGQFYDERTPPPLILVSAALPNAELLEAALAIRAEGKVKIVCPERGEKRDIVEMALTNAREQLGRRQAENSAQRELLEGVAETFALESPPRRIEVYDNSHIQGTHAVGAMIVAGPEGFEKGEYRKFNIKPDEAAPGDDFAMMHQVLTRRFTRLMAEDADKAKRPDLVLIDGGPGQLAAVAQVFADLGIEQVGLVAISKAAEHEGGFEHFHQPGKAPFRLPEKSPVLYYLQRLRDEAHRFVIGSHRARRTKAIGANPLDEIEGVGAARKKAILRHFGSARAVSGAALTDLETVPGVSGKLARKIFDFFHPGGRQE
jgi:excinuclease ABC subunit C